MILEANEVIARKIVSAICEDFTHRRGLDGFWDGINDQTQGEIITEWRRVTCAILNEQKKGRT